MRPLLANLVQLLVLLTFGSALEGCTSPIYGFGVFNASSDEIYAVSIEYRLGSRTHTEYFGSIGSHGYTSIDGNPRPIPKRYTVKWAGHCEQVDLPKIKDEDKFYGDVWFRISDAGVTIVPMTMDEEMDRAAQKLPLMD